MTGADEYGDREDDWTHAVEITPSDACEMGMFTDESGFTHRFAYKVVYHFKTAEDAVKFKLFRTGL